MPRSVYTEELTVPITLISTGSRVSNESRGKMNTFIVEHALSKLGASKGGRARAAKLSPTKRKQIAKKAAAKRWCKASYSSVALDARILDLLKQHRQNSVFTVPGDWLFASPEKNGKLPRSYTSLGEKLGRACQWIRYRPGFTAQLFGTVTVRGLMS